MCKLAAISAGLIATISQGFPTCLKTVANLQDFSENKLRYCAEIPYNATQVCGYCSLFSDSSCENSSCDSSSDNSSSDSDEISLLYLPKVPSGAQNLKTSKK